VTIEMLEGRTVEQKSRFAEAVTKNVVDILGAKADEVIIIFHELPKTSISKSGVLYSISKK
jgi:4-oxalocrotonate tautomerase